MNRKEDIAWSVTIGVLAWLSISALWAMSIGGGFQAINVVISLGLFALPIGLVAMFIPNTR